MKFIAYLFAGILFGIALVKGEAASWYRMQEMFHFQGFHMYGIFMTAIPTGALSVWLLKKYGSNSAGEAVTYEPKVFRKGTVLGSLVFGFGWALTGACPGPFYAQIGSGATVMIATLLFALIGTWTFGAVQHRLPE